MEQYIIMILTTLIILCSFFGLIATSKDEKEIAIKGGTLIFLALICGVILGKYYF